MVLFRRALSFILALQLAFPVDVWAATYSREFAGQLAILKFRTAMTAADPTIQALDQLKLEAFSVVANNPEERALLEAFIARIEQIKEVRNVIEGNCTFKRKDGTTFDHEALASSSSAEMLRELTVTDCAPEDDISAAEQLATLLGNNKEIKSAVAPKLDRLIAHAVGDAAYDHMLLDHMTVGAETGGIAADLARDPELTTYDALLDAEIWRVHTPDQIPREWNGAKKAEGKKQISATFRMLLERETGSNPKGAKETQQNFIKATQDSLGGLHRNYADLIPKFWKSFEIAKGLKERNFAKHAAQRVAQLKEVRARDSRPGSLRLVEGFKQASKQYQQSRKGHEASNRAAVRLAGIVTQASSVRSGSVSDIRAQEQMNQIAAARSEREQRSERMKEYDRKVREIRDQYDRDVAAWRASGYQGKQPTVLEKLPSLPTDEGIEPGADIQRMIQVTKTEMEKAKVREAEMESARRLQSWTPQDKLDSYEIPDLIEQGKFAEAKAKLAAIVKDAVAVQSTEEVPEVLKDLERRVQNVPEVVFKRFTELQRQGTPWGNKDLFLRALAEPHAELHNQTAFSVVDQGREFMSMMRMATRSDLDANPLTYVNPAVMEYIENDALAPTDEQLYKHVDNLNADNALAVRNISSLKYEDNGQEKTDYREQINKALRETPHAMGGLLTIKSQVAFNFESVPLSRMLCGRLKQAFEAEEKNEEKTAEANSSYGRKMAWAGIAVLALGAAAIFPPLGGLVYAAGAGGMALGTIGVIDARANVAAVTAQRQRFATLAALARAERRTADAATGAEVLSAADQAVVDAKWSEGVAWGMAAISGVPGVTMTANAVRGVKAASGVATNIIRAEQSLLWTVSNLALGGMMAIKSEVDMAPQIRYLEESYAKLKEAATRLCSGSGAGTQACVDAEIAAAKAKGNVEYEKLTQNLNRFSAIAGGGLGVYGVRQNMVTARLRAQLRVQRDKFDAVAKQGLEKGRNAVVIKDGKITIRSRRGETADLDISDLSPHEKAFLEQLAKTTNENNSVISATSEAGLSPDLAEVFQRLKLMGDPEAAQAFLREIEDAKGNPTKREALLKKYCSGPCRQFCAAA